MKCKKINKSFAGVNFIATINYDLLITLYYNYASYKKINYSSVEYCKQNYKMIYSLYKNLNIGFFKDLFTDIVIV